MSDPSIILNAFRPNSEIVDPHTFAGRIREIKVLTQALYTDNSCPIIYGDKGLGKTSLAAQIARIALGDVELLSILDHRKLILKEEHRFMPVRISCSDAIKTKDEILQRIINTSESFYSLDELNQFVLNGKSNKKKINLKIFEAETVKNHTQVSKKSYSRLNMEDKLSAIINTMYDHGIKKVLLIIDELDRVSNTKGLANFIKNTSSDSIKFLLVGIAQDISSLISDHSSLERNLMPVKVSRMKAEELHSIIDKALISLKAKGYPFTFTKEAKDLLVKTAAGFPWFIHILASEALRIVWERGTRTEVDPIDVKLSINELSNNRFSQQFSDDYQKAVRDSIQREIVLRLFAHWADDDIPTSEIYKYATSLKIKSPSGCKTDLMEEKYGNILIKKPGHERGVVRFRNAMFKRYINIRSSIYEGVKEKIEDYFVNK